MKIQFIESPTGAFKLAYDAGMIANIPEKLAAELIEKGFAVKAPVKKRATKAETSEKRDKVSGNNRAGQRAGNANRGKDLAKGRS